MRLSTDGVYGPVAQGEGALLGTLMPFIRTAGCNLACTWCDSAYTWRKGYEYTEHTPEEVCALVEQRLMRSDGTRCTWVSLTGGEPSIQHDAEEVVRLLVERLGVRVVVETNGITAPTWYARPEVFVSCSPKLPASGQDTPARRRKVARLVERRKSSRPARASTQYKFVIASEGDLAALLPYCEEVGIDTSGAPDTAPVYVQPDGYLPLAQYLDALAWLANSVPAGVRVTPQVHRLVHGPDARAV